MKLEVDLAPSVKGQLAEVAKEVWREEMKNEFKRRNYPDWMDLETTTNYLNISRSNLSRFIKELDFPVSVIAQTKRCNKKKVDEWMEQHEL